MNGIMQVKIAIVDNLDKTSTEKSYEEAIDMPNIEPTNLAKIHYSMGMTIDLGNYRSAKVSVGVELPADVSVENSLEDTYEKARDFASEKVTEEVGILSSLKKGK